MADINQMITLGIGTPADIEHFILVGLNANPSVAAVIATEIAGRGSYDPVIEGRGSYDVSIDGRGSYRPTMPGDRKSVV